MQLGLRTQTFGQGDLSWLGSALGTTNTRSVTVVTSSLTPATHFPQGFLPSGLPLAKYTSGVNSGKYTVYNSGASDGSQTLVGFLLYAVPIHDTTQDAVGALLDHGRIVLARLPITVDSAGQSAVTGRIWFV